MEKTAERIRVRTRPPAKHVRLDGYDDFKVRCHHCGAAMSVPKPLNMLQVARLALKWDLMHRRCPKPPPKQVPPAPKDANAKGEAR